MTGYRRTLFAALLTMLWASAAVAQASFDCAKAATISEKAICADPALAAADTAMMQALAGLLKELPPDQQTALRADQSRWVIDRDGILDRGGACLGKEDAALTKCLLAATQMRQHFIAGEGDNGPAGAPALLPVFFVVSRDTAYAIIVTYAQFATPAAPKFNAAAHELVFGKDGLSEYRRSGPNPKGGTNLYRVSYDATYLDPRLASVAFEFADYAGGAHPNNWRSALLWNPATDTSITIADLLADPAQAVPAISALCKAQADKEAWWLFDPDFPAVVKDDKRWAITKDGVTIMFNPYSVRSYSAGAHDCTLTYAKLAGWLKPGGPLPPK